MPLGCGAIVNRAGGIRVEAGVEHAGEAEVRDAELSDPADGRESPADVEAAVVGLRERQH